VKRIHPGARPAGCRSAAVSGCYIRHGQGTEQQVTLIRQGAAALLIGEREMAFTATPDAAGGIDLTLHGMKSYVMRSWKATNISSSRNGRFGPALGRSFRRRRRGAGRRGQIVAPLPGTVVHCWPSRRDARKGRADPDLEVEDGQTLRAPLPEC